MKKFNFSPNVLQLKLLGILILLLCYSSLYSSSLNANPPSKVARLTGLIGSVSFLASGVSDWTEAQANRPITIGDKLWIDEDGYAELQLGTSKICMGASTTVAILNLDNKNTQLQLLSGRLNIIVKSLKSEHSYEIDTPNLAFSITEPGTYRIEVDPKTHKTMTVVYSGKAEVYGEKNTSSVAENQAFNFSGSNLESQNMTPVKDSMDELCFDRIIYQTNTDYVSEDMVGTEDLNLYGTWRVIDPYGPVWIPKNVDLSWMPYHTGQWTWIEPWGWTWIDAATWGFAPFHYGRWAFIENYWAWVPGPMNSEPVYAPALVVLISLDDHSVGWFALGPNEVYWPPYSYTQNYFVQLNAASTKLSEKELDKIFVKKSKKQLVQNFKNFKVNAITTFPVDSFRQGQPTLGASQNINPEILSSAKITNIAQLPVTKQSVVGTAKITKKVPSPEIMQAKTIFKATPPPAKTEVLPQETQEEPEKQGTQEKPAKQGMQGKKGKQGAKGAETQRTQGAQGTEEPQKNQETQGNQTEKNAEELLQRQKTFTQEQEKQLLEEMDRTNLNPFPELRPPQNTVKPEENNKNDKKK